MTESNKYGSSDDTLVSYGLVLRLDLERIPALKRYLAEHEIKMCYQVTSVGRLRVVREEDRPLTIEDGRL